MNENYFINDGTDHCENLKEYFTINTNKDTTPIRRVAILEEFPYVMIYSNGDIFNCLTDTWLNLNVTRKGYRTVTLRDKNNNRKTISVHRLVAMAFLGPQPDGTEINHIDEDPTNNKILFDKKGNIVYTNLEYITHKANCNHGTRNTRIKNSTEGKNKMKQAFKVIINGTEEHTYNTITEFITAHPSQKRLTWYYRLNKKKKEQEKYFSVEGENWLQIIPIMNEEKKGEQN